MEGSGVRVKWIKSKTTLLRIRWSPKAIKRRVRERIKIIKPENKKKFYDVMNYLFNAILVGVPFYFIGNIWFDPDILRYAKVVLAFWVILPFMEHYYVWFRRDWMG